ncbi:MAG: alpha/beta fold hydrolase [Pseudomonadota bacterium]
MQPVQFETEDGVTIGGELIGSDNPDGVSVFHGATGVPMRYYKPFAKWLSSERNHIVLIYSYRDSERVAASDLRRSKSNMSDWGIRDQSAALDFVLKEFPDLPVHTIGHSLGGMCLPYHPNAGKVETHIAVNAGPAYWKNHPWHYMPQVILFWYIVGPLATWFFGYMPGKMIGLNANLPPEVYWQWRRWCTNTRFYEIDWNRIIEPPDFSKVTCKVKLVSTQDDVMIPPSQVQKLARYFPKAAVNFEMIVPETVGLKAIGHIGIFSEKSKAAWQSVIA